jgi:hypothetical protein
MRVAEDSVTLWFQPTVKPKHIGVYQIYARSMGHEQLYRYWDGTHWYLGHSTPRKAAKKAEVRLIVFERYLLPWRGLKHKPKNYG